MSKWGQPITTLLIKSRCFRNTAWSRLIATSKNAGPVNKAAKVLFVYSYALLNIKIKWFNSVHYDAWYTNLVKGNIDSFVIKEGMNYYGNIKILKIWEKHKFWVARNVEYAGKKE